MQSFLHRAHLPLLLVLPLAQLSAAQDMPAPPPVPNPTDVPIDSNLWRLEQRWLARAGQASDLRALQSDLEQDRYVFDGARRVHVEVERRDGRDLLRG